MSDDIKVIDMHERRKRAMPQAQASMCSMSDALASLLAIMEAQGAPNLLATTSNGWHVDIYREKSILAQPMKCSACKWLGSVSQAVPDIDGEGSLGCPSCLDQNVRVVVHAVNGDAGI